MVLHPNAFPMMRMFCGRRPLLKRHSRKWISWGAIPPPTLTGVPSSRNKRVNAASESPKYNGFSPVRIRNPCRRYACRSATNTSAMGKNPRVQAGCRVSHDE